MVGQDAVDLSTNEARLNGDQAAISLNHAQGNRCEFVFLYLIVHTGKEFFWGATGGREKRARKASRV